MTDNRRGQGRKPKPFMLAGTGKVGADAVWDSNRGLGDAVSQRSRAEGRQQREDPTTSQPQEREHAPGIR